MTEADYFTPRQIRAFAALKKKREPHYADINEYKIIRQWIVNNEVFKTGNLTTIGRDTIPRQLENKTYDEMLDYINRSKTKSEIAKAVITKIDQWRDLIFISEGNIDKVLLEMLST